jgi:predicted dehydrogenase
MVPEQAVRGRLLKNERSSDGQKDHLKMEGEMNLTTRLPIRKQINVANVGWFANDNGPECRTVAFCDTDKTKLESLSKQHPQMTMYSDFSELLKHPGLDALVISTPNFMHAAQAVAALNAGKHVMLEKPMGISREEAGQILVAQRKSGKILTIDFEMRISPYAQRVKSMIESKEYGDLRRIEFIHHRGCWLEAGSGLWRVRPEKSGGFIFMEPIHEVDIFRLFAGEVKSAQATVAPTVLPQYKYEDNICAHLFFENGVVGTILTSHTHSAVPENPAKNWKNTPEYHAALGHDMNMIFTFTGGSIGVDLLAQKIFFNRFEEWPRGSGGYRVVQDRIEDHSGGNDMMHFRHDIDAMRREFILRCACGEPPVQDAMDAWRTHMVCLAIEASVQEDFCRVNVDYTLPAGI